MPNYSETTIDGTSWLRASRILIKNGKNTTPSIHIVEEKVISVEGKELLIPSSELHEQFDPVKTFNLLNSSTGEVVGTATYQDVYEMLYSVYIHLATLRDIAEAPVSPENT